ncbi:hypothetical protein HDK77DRAFT_438466 [Phyllosticta capitalensis]
MNWKELIFDILLNFDLRLTFIREVTLGNCVALLSIPFTRVRPVNRLMMHSGGWVVVSVAIIVVASVVVGVAVSLTAIVVIVVAIIAAIMGALIVTIIEVVVVAMVVAVVVAAVVAIVVAVVVATSTIIVVTSIVICGATIMMHIAALGSANLVVSTIHLTRLCGGWIENLRFGGQSVVGDRRLCRSKLWMRTLVATRCYCCGMGHMTGRVRSLGDTSRRGFRFMKSDGILRGPSLLWFSRNL